MSFTTFNQFDEKFKNIGKFGGDRNACPLFALFTAKNFLDNENIGKTQHEINIESAVDNYISHSELPKYMAFDELVQFTNIITKDQIKCTTPELINLGILSYEHIFKEPGSGNYSVVFLKNSNFIVVNVTCLFKNDALIEVYSVRDCHEKEQYDFTSREDIIIHLNKTYQFNELTVVDGVLIEEYGNIEFLVIDTPFQLIGVDNDMYNNDGITIELEDNESSCEDNDEWVNDLEVVSESDELEVENFDPNFFDGLSNYEQYLTIEEKKSLTTLQKKHLDIISSVEEIKSKVKNRVNKENVNIDDNNTEEEKENTNKSLNTAPFAPFKSCEDFLKYLTNGAKNTEEMNKNDNNHSNDDAYQILELPDKENKYIPDKDNKYTYSKEELIKIGQEINDNENNKELLIQDDSIKQLNGLDGNESVIIGELVDKEDSITAWENEEIKDESENNNDSTLSEYEKMIALQMQMEDYGGLGDEFSTTN